MRSVKEIEQRRDSLRARICLLQDKYNNQLQRHHSDRDRVLMKFILEEQSTYQLALDQLEWALEQSEPAQ